MDRARRHVAIVLVLSLTGAATAEFSDNNGASWGADRASALARIAEVQEHRARLQALRSLRAALERFEDVAVARAEGYDSIGACLSDAEGGLGVPFTRAGAPVSPDAVHRTPHLLAYEPRADGTLMLVGAQFAVLRDAWHRAGLVERPRFHGQPFSLVDHLFDEPAYVLFVWFTAPNPAGQFAAWHPAVSCEHDAMVGGDARVRRAQHTR